MLKKRFQTLSQTTMPKNTQDAPERVQNEVGRRNWAWPYGTSLQVPEFLDD